MNSAALELRSVQELNTGGECRKSNTRFPRPETILVPMRDDRPLGIYLHLPFCGYRCAYCDFAILANQDRRIPEYLAALHQEIAQFADARGRRSADSVHFGGGTPSRIPAGDIGRLIAALREAFDFDPEAEIGFEANPDDLSAEYLAQLHEVGVERLTVGVQSLSPTGLRVLGRPGDPKQSVQAIGRAAAERFRSLGIDLIFGWPGQSAAQWDDELEQAAALPVQHLSLYALETDGRTPLVRTIERGDLPAPDSDRAAEMYEAAVRRLSHAGWERYEISNFARNGHESRHNLKYWTDQPYVGFGMAASSYVDGCRWTGPRRYSDYLDLARAGFVPREIELYEPDRRAGEAMMFGLRKGTGIDLHEIAARHGAAAVERRLPALQNGIHVGLLEWKGTRLRLTERGFLLADELFVDLV